MDLFSLVAKITLDTSEYESGLGNAESKIGDFGNKLKSGFGAVAKVSAAAVGAATGAVTAFAKSSIDAGKTFDTSMAQVAATMGKTMEEMEGITGQTDTAFGHFSGTLREFAQFMGANTSFSASQAADALNYMALAGYDAQTSMDMLPNVLNLAAAGGIQLAYASDMVTDASSALGLSIDQTSDLVDQMAKTSSKSNTSVSQLGEAILTIGATARGVKGGTVELSTVLGALADNGIKGAEGGTHLRNMLLSLQTPTKDGTEALAQLGMTYADMYDEAGNMRALPEIFNQLSGAMQGMNQQSKDAIISGIFNKTDLAAANALIGTSSERFEELAQAITGAWYTSDALSESLKANALPSLSDIESNLAKLGIDTDEFSAALDKSGGNADKFADMLFNASERGTTFEDITKALGGDLDALGVAFNETTGAAQQMADTQLDTLDGSITKFKSALEGVQIVVSDMLTPALRNFVDLGTSGLSEVTTALQNGDFSGAMEAMGEVLAQAIQMVIDMIPQMLEAGMQLLSALAQGLIENIPQITDAALQIVVMLSEYIIQSLPNILQTGVDILMTLNQGIVEALPMLMTAATQAVLSLLQYLIENLPQIIEAGTQAIVTLTQGLVQALPQLIPAAYEAVLTLVMALVENVDQLIPAALQLITALVQGLIEALPVLIEYVPEIIIAIVNTLVDNFPLIMETALELLIAFGEALIDNVDEIINAVNEVNEEINTKFKEVVDKALSWGADLISNFVDGLKQKWNQLKETVGGIASSIKELIGFSEPEKGPLSDFHTYAPDMMDLFAQGIRENIPLVENSLNSMGNMINKKMQFGIGEDFDRIGESMQNAVNMTADIGNAAFGSTTQTEDVNSTILNYILQILQMMMEYFPDFAKNKGMSEADIYTIMNRQMGMAVAQ